MLGTKYFFEGLRIVRSSLKRRKQGFKKYSGGAKEICERIVFDCWNSRYFQTSIGNFSEFWTRDFGFCCEALWNLELKKQCRRTLYYALEIFSNNNRITTTIAPKGFPLDFYTYSPDSLPYLVRSLRITNSKDLIEKYNAFLEKEIKKYFEVVIDKNTGLVKKRKFSSMKDQSIRQSSCYDNCMVAMLNNELKKLKLTNPFKEYNFKKIIKENFWNGGYFYDDLRKKEYVAGDANVFPFWLDIFNEKNMLKSSIEAIQEARLDRPFPLKYTNIRLKDVRFVPIEIFIHSYEADSVWMHMGPLYIDILKKIDMKKAKFHIDQYKRLIENYGSYLEVFNSKGKPFSTPFYFCDEGMLWASLYLNLLK